MFVSVSPTIPIINFLGSVHSEKEHMCFVYSIRTYVREHAFRIWLKKSNFEELRQTKRNRGELWYSCVDEKPKELRWELQKSCTLIFASRKSSCVLFPLQKSCVFVVFRRAAHKIWQKNSNFFRKSYKNLKKLVENLIFKVKFWRRTSKQKTK